MNMKMFEEIFVNFKFNIKHVHLNTSYFYIIRHENKP